MQSAIFWRDLFEILVTKLNFSFDYHPKMDGQSENVNSTMLDHLLKICVNEVGKKTSRRSTHLH